MPDLEALIAEHRRRLLERERVVLDALARRYERAIDTVADRAQQIASAPEGVSTNLRLARLSVLQVQMEQELARATSQSMTLIDRERRAVEIQAAADWDDLAGSVDVSVGLDPAAGERALGALAEGTPLSKLLAAANQAGLEAGKQALFTGVVLGDNPNKIAEALRSAMSISKTRAQTIARTEVLRAYRGSIRERMKNARGVVGWVWMAARDRRTCPMCWAMHGTKHRLEETFGTHPNCRCSQAPLAAHEFVDIRPGVEDFEELSRASQRAILGPAKHKAYERGLLDLPDVVGEGVSPTWGLVRWERSLADIVGVEQARLLRRV